MITQTLQLNLVPKGVWPRLYVSQYDAGSRTLTFEIYNGDQRFTLTSGTTAKIQGTKPDRHGFSYDADVDTSNNVITADITQQMTAAHGEAYCELVLFKSGQRIGTLNFVMMIQQAGLNDETDTSDSDLPDIIAEATEQMLTAEAYAKGTRNGTAVTSGQTGYHDNSKYYKEQAATQASNASTSATSANANALKAEGYAVGKQNGTTQTSGTYYHNNAQYYKEQAASSATNASTKAGEASTSANTASQKASAASTSAQTASDKALVAEGYAKGTQNGTPVGSTSPYYHNNAEYFKNLANPTVAANVSFNNSGTDMSSTNVQDGIVENRTSIQNLSTVISKNGAKNLLPFDIEKIKAKNTTGTWDGNTFKPNNANVTYTLNSDGTVTVNGTNNTNNDNSANFDYTYNGSWLNAGNYIVSVEGATSNVNDWWFIYDATTSSDLANINNAAFSYNGTDNIFLRYRVKAGKTVSNVTLKPMIRLASDTDPTYEPWAMTNQQLTTDKVGMDLLSEVGAVNYFNNRAVTAVENGITWTVYDDKSMKANGTQNAPGNSVFELGYQSLKKGTYRLTGCPEDGGYNTSIQLYLPNDQYAVDYGDGAVFTLNEDASCRCNIWVKHNASFSNKVFKPMIAPVSYNGPYVPYAKSNKELTDDVIGLDGEAVKIVDSGQISENSSHSFTCTNYEGYRLSIYSIGTDNAGMVALFGKHPFVSDIRCSIFYCNNRGSNAPQISVSGSTLTITTTNINCYYVIERIRNT